MIRRPPRSTRTDTLFPYTTLFRSQVTGQRWTELGGIAIGCGQAVQSVSRWTIARLRQFLTIRDRAEDARFQRDPRSEEHTSELQSLMRISYAVFCLKKKKHKTPSTTRTYHQLHTQHETTTTN